jgi:methylenetetrahydrofolate reductase (NADPH)
VTQGEALAVTSIFERLRSRGQPAARGLHDLIRGHSIEVLPRTAARVEDFPALLAQGTRIYIAHVDGTPFDDMLATARRLRADGFPVMPHIPARSLSGSDELALWIRRYREEADVTEALVIAGGAAQARGDLTDTMQLLETGLFDAHGFTRLHVAGHPEGNLDIDRRGGTGGVDAALRLKQDFSERTDAEMAIVTQFGFAAQPVIAWAERIRAAGITLPVHVGIAGPARMQTLIRFAVACGVGASLQVLQKRARDVSKLVRPYEPTEVLLELADYKAQHPKGPIDTIHFFPLGGIHASAEWTERHGRSEGMAP